MLTLNRMTYLVFFLSGPGINRSFSNNAENIALVPQASDYFQYATPHIVINIVNARVVGAFNNDPTCINIDSGRRNKSLVLFLCSQFVFSK